MEEHNSLLDSWRKSWKCKRLNTRWWFCIIWQANGRVEGTKNIFKTNITKTIQLHLKGWVDIYPKALWTYRTTWWITTSCTPYELIYGKIALLPIKIEVQTMSWHESIQGIVSKNCLNEREIWTLSSFSTSNNHSSIIESSMVRQVDKKENIRSWRLDLVV